MSNSLRLIVGLGNPGSRYTGTRHNVGFMVLDRLAVRHDLGAPRERFHGLLSTGRIGGAAVTLLKPTTFMNLSGRSVAEAQHFYKIEPESLLVVVDDVALEAGVIRMRAHGGPGGHNGLIDIERSLGTENYPRLRVGIGRATGAADQVGHVLGRFSAEQLEKIGPALENACDAVECWSAQGAEQAMNRFNVKG